MELKDGIGILEWGMGNGKGLKGFKINKKIVSIFWVCV
jgi:hypothetical protein